MKNLIIFIAILLSASCYAQRLPIEKENNLICSALADYRKTIDSTKQIVVLSSLIETEANRKLLFEYLEQNNIKFRVEDAMEVKIKAIRRLNCLPEGLLVMTDRSRYDSLSTAYTLPFELENNILFKEDTTLGKKIPDKLKGVVPISLGKPWYWKNYAVISIHLFSQPYVLAYRLNGNKWEDLGMVYDPR